MVSQDKIDYFFLRLDGCLVEGLDAEEAMLTTIASYARIFRPKSELAKAGRLESETAEVPFDIKKPWGDGFALGELGVNVRTRTPPNDWDSYTDDHAVTEEEAAVSVPIVGDDDVLVKVGTGYSVLDAVFDAPPPPSFMFPSAEDKAADQLDELIEAIQDLKPTHRGEMQRYFAIVITTLEQAKAMYRTFILGND